MRDHSRAVAGHLNGVHSGQEFWFSLEGPDVSRSPPWPECAGRGLCSTTRRVHHFNSAAGTTISVSGTLGRLSPHIAEPVIGRAFARPGGSCGLLADLGRRPPHFRKAPPAADLHKRAGPGARPFEDANGTSERSVEPGALRSGAGPPH